MERLKEHPEGIVFENKRIYRKYETGGLRADGRKGFPTPQESLRYRLLCWRIWGIRDILCIRI